MNDRVLLVELPEKGNANVSSPLMAEALDTGKLESPLAEALSGLSDQFLEAALGREQSGAVGKAALLTLTVSRASRELGTDRVKVRTADLLRWCRCMTFLLNLECLRRTGAIQSVQADPISEPDSMLTFS